MILAVKAFSTLMAMQLFQTVGNATPHRVEVLHALWTSKYRHYETLFLINQALSTDMRVPNPPLCVQYTFVGAYIARTNIHHRS